MFPQKYDYTVSRRWGVDMMVASPIISVTILIPGYKNEEITPSQASDAERNNYPDSQIQIVINEQSINQTMNNNVVISDANSLMKGSNTPKINTDDSLSTDNRLSYLSENMNYDNGYVNDMKAPLALPLIEDEKNNDAKLIYKPLSNLDLKQPIRLQMWLNLENLQALPRANPQCVHWRVTNG